jgi:hypothetical protein
VEASQTLAWQADSISIRAKKRLLERINSIDSDNGRIAFRRHSAEARKNAVTLDFRWDSARNFTT